MKALRWHKLTISHLSESLSSHKSRNLSPKFRHSYFKKKKKTKETAWNFLCIKSSVKITRNNSFALKEFIFPLFVHTNSILSYRHVPFYKRTKVTKLSKPKPRRKRSSIHWKTINNVYGGAFLPDFGQIFRGIPRKKSRLWAKMHRLSPPSPHPFHRSGTPRQENQEWETKFDCFGPKLATSQWFQATVSAGSGSRLSLR